MKGRFGWDFVQSPKRLTKPLIKKNGNFVEASWDEALNLVAEKLSDVKKNQGLMPSAPFVQPSVLMKRITSCKSLPGSYRHEQYRSLRPSLT